MYVHIWTGMVICMLCKVELTARGPRPRNAQRFATLLAQVVRIYLFHTTWRISGKPAWIHAAYHCNVSAVSGKTNRTHAFRHRFFVFGCFHFMVSLLPISGRMCAYSVKKEKMYSQIWVNDWPTDWLTNFRWCCCQPTQLYEQQNDRKLPIVLNFVNMYMVLT